MSRRLTLVVLGAWNLFRNNTRTTVVKYDPSPCSRPARAWAPLLHGSIRFGSAVWVLWSVREVYFSCPKLPGVSWNDPRPARVPLVPPDNNRKFHYTEKSNALTVVCWEGGPIDHPTAGPHDTPRPTHRPTTTAPTWPSSPTASAVLALLCPVRGTLRISKS